MPDTEILARKRAATIAGPATLRAHLLALVQMARPSQEEHAHERWEDAGKRSRAGSAFFHDLICAIQGGMTLDEVVSLAQFAAVESTKFEALCRRQASDAWALWEDEYHQLRQREPDSHPPQHEMQRWQVIEAVLAAGEEGTAGASLLTEPPTVERREREFHAQGGQEREG